MNRLRTLLLIASIALTSSQAWSAGLFEREVVFSEAQIQAELEKAKPQRLSYGGMLAIALKEAPRITLEGTDGRARIATGLEVELQGNPPIHVDVTGSAGIRYDDRSKAFYLEKPAADSISAAALDPQGALLVQLAMTQLMTAYFRTKPVYVLRDDASPQEATARWLLKSVRIEPGRVVATLSTL